MVTRLCVFAGRLVPAAALAACVPPAEPLPLDGTEASGHGPQPHCELGSAASVYTDGGETVPGYVRGLDGALLLATVAAEDGDGGFDATVTQRWSAAGATDEAAFVPTPCESGHLPFEAWSVEGRRLIWACGGLADSPDVEQILSAMPSSRDELRCPPTACEGGACAYGWLWLTTPRTCDDVLRASPDAASAEYRIDPDGFAGEIPDVQASCRMEPGAGYTRVLGVDWHDDDAWIEELVAEPVGPGLESAAALRGYVRAAALSQWPAAEVYPRFLFRCEPDTGAVLEILTGRLEVTQYLLGLADSARATSDSFSRLDGSSYLGDKPWAWGRDNTGTWGDSSIDISAEDRIAIHPMVIYAGPGLKDAAFRVQAGQMRCDRQPVNVGGRWEVWIR